MDLFEVRDGIAFPSIHALIIEPYKSMWEKDTTPGRGECIKIFTYIECLLSPKLSNGFHSYNEDIRGAKIKKHIWGNENYQSELYNASEVIRGIKVYKEFLEAEAESYSSYVDSRKAFETLKDYLRSVDFSERTTGGTAVTKPKDITTALKDMPEVEDKMEKQRLKVISQLNESAKTRGQREIGMYER